MTYKVLAYNGLYQIVKCFHGGFFVTIYVFNTDVRLLHEGNFVLVVSEGSFGGKPSAYYDMYRIQGGKIAEHWDTIEAIPPRAEWKNPNGKFEF